MEWQTCVVYKPPSKPRIAFLSSSRDCWGAEESLLLLAKYAARSGAEPALIAPSGDLTQRWAREVGTTIMLAPDADRGRSRAYNVAKHGLRAPASAHVAFSNDVAAFMALATLSRARTSRLVYDLHDRLPRRVGRRKVAVVAQAFDTVIAVSDFAASQVAGHPDISVRKRPIEVSTPAYRGASPRDPARVDGRRPVVGVVGRIDPDKELELALAVGELLRGSATIELFGAPSPVHAAYAERLRERSSANIRWRGREAPETIYAGIDVLLITNAHEALGRTVLEAQLAGIPVVAPDAGGTSALIANGRGVQYAARDPQSAASAVLQAGSLPADHRLRISREVACESDPVSYAEFYVEQCLGSATVQREQSEGSQSAE